MISVKDTNTRHMETKDSAAGKGHIILDFLLKCCYNVLANSAETWTGIEVVITALTRNQVYPQGYRGFESHPVRQTGIAVLTKTAIPVFSSTWPDRQQHPVIVFVKHRRRNRC